MTPSKFIYGSMSLMFTLGFYRGFEQYKYIAQTSNDVAKTNLYAIGFGIFNGSLYMNPGSGVFAIAHEYEKAKLLLKNECDEKTYYSGAFLLK